MLIVTDISAFLRRYLVMTPPSGASHLRSEFRDLLLIEACQPTLEALAIEPAAAHPAVRRDADGLQGDRHLAIVVDVDLPIAISDLWHRRRLNHQPTTVGVHRRRGRQRGLQRIQSAE